MLKGLETQLLVAVPSTPGDATTHALTPNGTATTFGAGANDAQANIAGYESTTGHNIPAAFVAYRDQAGLASIGLAISEPFWSNVKVAGQPKDVLIQAFERRVLTYTPTNPAPFRVEFGNIGTQYYTWRYSTVSAPPVSSMSATRVIPTMIGPIVPVTPPTATALTTVMPTATTGVPAGPPCAAFASAAFTDAPPMARRNMPITLTVRLLDGSGNVCGDGTQAVIADTGTTSVFAGGGKAPNGASFVIVTVLHGVATVTVTMNAPNASASGPVAIGVYNVRAMTDIQNGGFGVPVSPEYKPSLV